MSETIGFVIADVARLMRRRFDERARDSGSSVTQWRTLKVVARFPGINQGKLAEFLEIEPITACRMIDRLEEAGFVERRRDPADRRAWQIHVTEKADPVLQSFHLLADAMTEEALQGLSARQREELFAALSVVRSNLSNSSESKEAANG